MRRRKRKFSRFTIRSKYIFILLTLLCALLLFFSYRYQRRFASVKDAVYAVFEPAEKAFYNVKGFIGQKVQYFKEKGDLIAENEQLKSELEEKTAQNTVLLQEKYELEDLRALFELDQTYGDYPKVAARVISRNTSNWYDMFVIDKGSEDGLSVGMNVLAGNGLCGIINECGAHYSRVRAIIDDGSYVTGNFQGTKETCLVRGDLTETEEGLLSLEVSLIDKDADIKTGAAIVTSQLSDQFLPGILIGYLTDVKVDASTLTMSGHLSPVVDFSDLTTVLVITEVKNSEELESMLSGD
ncbi:MAG: rod shape-determining protein MreC [Lachnospiraceae bacterium]|nr:rod shape-determining protein MreC [Lachnospiraceae bacterium]